MKENLLNYKLLFIEILIHIQFKIQNNQIQQNNMHTFPPGFYKNYPQMHQKPVYLERQQPIQQIIYSNKKLEHINCVLPETEESGGLYIGDTISTLRTQHITNNKIEAILCLNSEAARNAHLTRAHFDYKYIEIQDHPQYPIKLHFENACQFIDKHIKNKKNVLVQCHAGVSRSATIICAYLIKHKSWIPQQAIHHLKQRRHRAKPNAGFWKQVEQYWIELNMKKNIEEQNNLKTPIKINTNLNPNTQLTQTLENQPKTGEKQQKTTASKSDRQLQTPIKQNNLKQSRQRSNHKSLTKYIIPSIGNKNKQYISLNKTLNIYQFNSINRKISGLTLSIQQQPIQTMNNHQIFYTNQPSINHQYRTHTTQSIYSPYIPPQYIQPQNNYQQNVYRNNNGFIRRI